MYTSCLHFYDWEVEPYLEFASVIKDVESYSVRPLKTPYRGMHRYSITIKYNDKSTLKKLYRFIDKMRSC